ncbi:class I SAM-dependent methyltransferase [Zoogloea oleivorans]|uniref:site-specific DNA-methyltransferase (adenine-specific) n=1 Tax=Zoogloea oleivorans TaxID=1552750 RepID=A0A6C2CK03_9RHOO|nr:class I SAM-dependent methyltransferase [Zoogloea oleivorans]TYC54291.1 class I SAM-dependent methyltransferase [Zoogloea oleivorans]
MPSASTSPPLLPDLAALGQVFTPERVVRAMLRLRHNTGRVLEPSCGDGAFLHRLHHAVGIEVDPRQSPPGALNQDFFAYPESEKFDTVIGNPPYVRYQDVSATTRALLRQDGFDGRSNLYLFFIEKCIRHLAPGGELIFITPRDFLKATSARALNRQLFKQGTITHAIELGDARVFADAVPNCLIWRYELDNLSHNTAWARIGQGDDLDHLLEHPPWMYRHFSECAGHLLFSKGEYSLSLADVASVKVGAVSGADGIYASETDGNRDFVSSATARSGKTRRMIWCEPGAAPPAALLPHRERLLARRIRRFDETNWWQWGRGYPQSNAPRVYVNSKTRQPQPFFLHPCPNFDGAVMGIFPRRQDADLAAFRDALNGVDWADLGFVCDGRYLFTQRSLENAPLPASFRAFLPPAG